MPRQNLYGENVAAVEWVDGTVTVEYRDGTTVARQVPWDEFAAVAHLSRREHDDWADQLVAEPQP